MDINYNRILTKSYNNYRKKNTSLIDIESNFDNKEKDNQPERRADDLEHFSFFHKNPNFYETVKAYNDLVKNEDDAKNSDKYNKIDILV